MDSKQPTAAEVWFQIFRDRYPVCMQKVRSLGAQGCAQLAGEEADAAVAEFNKRFGEQP